MTATCLEYALPIRKGRPAVVAPPHPLYGGRLDHPVVEALASALTDSGYAALRFNWRGIGASSGRPSGDLADGIEDYRTALAEARRIAAGATGRRDARALAAGYSFGAITAAEVALDDAAGIERLVLVAPPVAMLDSVDLRSCEAPVHVVVGGSDSFAPVNALGKLLEPCREARLDVIPDADHFFSLPFWMDRLGELVRAALL